ncbi:MAG: chromosomal replication initiator protein DnaA [Planctomycetota bacterium]
MSDAVSTVWEEALDYLRRTRPNDCRPWFDAIVPVSLEAGVLGALVEDDVHRDFLREHAREMFKDAASSVTGHMTTVSFLAVDDLKDETPVVAATARRSPGEGGLTLTPDYTFDHFIVGPGNRLAHAAAVAVADNPGGAYNPIFIHGDVGLGKTHLLQATCLRIMQRFDGIRLFYTSCEGFVSRFIEDVQAGRMAEFRHTFRDVDVLAIDDIHFLAKRDRTQEEFFHTFNALYQLQKQIILSSDAPPDEIPDLEARLVSRFQWGLVAGMDTPGFDPRVEIIKEKGRLRGLSVPDDVACVIAERVSSNIRELEGVLTKIQLQAALAGKEPDVELAREAVGDFGPAASRPTMDAIIRYVTDHYGVRVSELQSKKRSRSVTVPRQICMYLARTYTDHSLGEIGGFFGGRDHTTVMHAIRTIEEKRGANADIRGSVEKFERQLGGRQPTWAAGRRAESRSTRNSMG